MQYVIDQWGNPVGFMLDWFWSSTPLLIIRLMKNETLIVTLLVIYLCGLKTIFIQEISQSLDILNIAF